MATTRNRIATEEGAISEKCARSQENRHQIVPHLLSESGRLQSCNDFLIQILNA